MSEALASRYATALVDTVFAPGSPVNPEQAISELRDFETMVASSADLKHILNSPAVSRARKRGVIANLAGAANLSGTVRNFLFVVVDRGRASIIPMLRKVVEEFVDARRGIARAVVSSAAPLNDGEKSAIAAELARITGKQTICDFQLDASLLGGVLARIGSTVYDGSVRGQLAALKSRLTA
jgi:F-type H+-transporting ATPase subunit delta